VKSTTGTPQQANGARANIQREAAAVSAGLCWITKSVDHDFSARIIRGLCRWAKDQALTWLRVVLLAITLCVNALAIGFERREICMQL
jgi:hypothetical protein